jgi:uncharacterized protein with GYD domain
MSALPPKADKIARVSLCPLCANRVLARRSKDGFAHGAVTRVAGMRNGMGAGRQKAYNCMVFAQNDPHDVEVAMKYVLLGNLSPEYASKQSERVKKAKAKLDKLGIKIESIHYTQGYYDFVDIVDAPNPEAMLAFSVWYSTQRLGRIQSMPAFDAKSFEAAIKDAAG